MIDMQLNHLAALLAMQGPVPVPATEPQEPDRGLRTDDVAELLAELREIKRLRSR